MKPEEIRSIRINSLARFWNKPNVTIDDLFNKAMTIGVTQQTAKSYVNTILKRYPKKIV